MKSNAVVFTDKGQVSFQEVETPQPGPDDVMLRTKYSWISNGTEVSFLRGERVDGIQPWKEGMRLPYPMVPGYQKVGTVEWIGENVQGLELGQWVFATITRINDVEFQFGGHIAIGPSPANEVIPLPTAMKGIEFDPSLYSGLVLAQVGYNSGIRGEARPGDCVAVIGDGMVGLWSAQTLQARGLRVAVVGRHEFRLDKFKATAGDLRLNSKGKDSHEWLQELKGWSLNNGGLQIAVDSVGSDTNAGVNTDLIQLLKRDGHFVAAGHHGANPLIDQGMLSNNEITLHCPAGWTRHRLELTMDWVTEGKLDMAGLITHRFPASAANEAWQVIRYERERTLGVVLEW